MERAPYYSIIVDSTSDISSVDQLSVTVRWKEISDNCEISCREAKVREIFQRYILTIEATTIEATRTLFKFWN